MNSSGLLTCSITSIEVTISYYSFEFLSSRNFSLFLVNIEGIFYKFYLKLFNTFLKKKLISPMVVL